MDTHRALHAKFGQSGRLVSVSGHVAAVFECTSACRNSCEPSTAVFVCSPQMEGMEDPKADSEEKNKQDAAVFSPQ